MDYGINVEGWIIVGIQCRVRSCQDQLMGGQLSEVEHSYEFLITY